MQEGTARTNRIATVARRIDTPQNGPLRRIFGHAQDCVKPPAYSALDTRRGLELGWAVVKPPPAVSDYFSELVGARYKKLGKKGRAAAARNAAKKGWAQLTKRQRNLEMKKRWRMRKKNERDRVKRDELLRERVAKRKAGLDD